MARATVAGSLLFWPMLLAGAAVLAPCLLLPAWLEQQAEREWLAAYQAHVAALQYRLRSVEKQIRHLQHDPAYVLRLAEQDFGELKVPHIETVRIEPSPSTDADTPPAPVTEAVSDRLPELASFIDALLQRHPRTAAFLDRQVRPWLLALGAGLILAAIGVAWLDGRSTFVRSGAAAEAEAHADH